MYDEREKCFDADELLECTCCGSTFPEHHLVSVPDGFAEWETMSFCSTACLGEFLWTHCFDVVDECWIETETCGRSPAIVYHDTDMNDDYRAYYTKHPEADQKRLWEMKRLPLEERACKKN